MCSTRGSIHTKVIKSSFRAIQKHFASGYLIMEQTNYGTNWKSKL
jgi:hypothetical protein